MAARRQNVVAGKAQSKTRKLLHEEHPPNKKRSRSAHFLVTRRQKAASLFFGLRGQTSPASLTIKSQIKVTELESSRYRGLLGVRVTYS